MDKHTEHTPTGLAPGDVFTCDVHGDQVVNHTGCCWAFLACDCLVIGDGQP